MEVSPHCHHQNYSCIKMDSDESHFNASLTVRDSHTTDSCIKMGSDESHLNASLTVAGQCHKTVSTDRNF